jgi:hypothetical protein
MGRDPREPVRSVADFRQVIHHEALYLAKQEGRNRLVVTRL